MGLVVVDEAARVPDELYYAVRPMLAVSGGRLMALGTPAGRRGWFYREWTEGAEPWQRVRVTADQCPRITPEFLASERMSETEEYVRGEMARQLGAGAHPRCAGCGGRLRPNVVLFEEMLPVDAYKRAEDACLQCEALLVVGSSLEVYPVAGLPHLAKEHGAKIVIVNNEPTACDRLADILLCGQAGEILPAIVKVAPQVAASAPPS